MTRAEAQRILLKSFDNDGKEWGDIVLISPRKGKSSWTKKEMYDAILQDRGLEGTGYNPIDGYLRYVKWKEEQKEK